MMKDFNYTEAAKKALTIELNGIQNLIERFDDQAFKKACEIILKCTGRVIVTGMGKSGHIGNKLAATFASTGTPSFFVHPGEAAHGDMGMITKGDVVIALSNSGETAEVTSLIPLLKRLHIPMISMTGKPKSTLATESEVHLNVAVDEEACPLDLAPTSSTTAALAMGDALAVSLLEARGFTAEDFAFSHPGGSLGRRLLLKVQDIMHKGKEIPAVTPDTPLNETLYEMTSKGLGMTTVIDADGKLAGIFTDGDLRRALDQDVNIKKTLVKEVMTPTSVTIEADILAAEALQIMEDNKVNALISVDNGKPNGVINMHDLLKAGVI